MDNIKLSQIMTKVYQYDNNYFVDIVETVKYYEAYLYRKDCGVKEFMFGIPKEEATFKTFLLLVSSNIKDHIAYYEEEFVDNRGPSIVVAEKDNIKIKTYEYKEDYLLDIIETEDKYEAYICHKEYGEKERVLNVSKENCTYEGFVEMLGSILDAFIVVYQDIYC